MQEGNWRKAGGLVAFYGRQDLVQAVANEPHFSEERQMIRDFVQHALSRSGKYVPFQECSVLGCKLPRCNLAGSTFCEGHHAVRFQQPPVLEDFVRNDVYKDVLRSFCEASRPEMLDAMDFMERAQDVAQLRSKQVLADRARTVYRQFVAPEAPQQLHFLADVDPKEGEAAAIGGSSTSRGRLGSALTADTGVTSATGGAEHSLSREQSGFSVANEDRGVEDSESNRHASIETPVVFTPMPASAPTSGAAHYP